MQIEMLEAAFELADMGFWLFPLHTGLKTPRNAGWQASATRDEKQIRHWWQTWPTGNIGIYAQHFGDSQALLVIDIDVKGSANGFETIEKMKLLDDRDFPPTWKVGTPSGGQHWIYVVDEPVRGGSKVFGLALDIQSAGRYIVGVGSKTEAGIYHWLPEE